MGLINSFAGGMAPGLADMGKQLTDYGIRDQLAQREIAARAEESKRLAEYQTTTEATQHTRNRGEAVLDQRTAQANALELQAAKGKEDRLTATTKATDKPVYPKIIKLKDADDHEYLIDENTGAIGRPVSATEGLPEKSHWFSPDEPAVPGTKAGIVWTASDGQELSGGLGSLYSQIKKPAGKAKKGAFDPNKYVVGAAGGNAGAPAKPVASMTQPAATPQVDPIAHLLDPHNVTPYEDKLKVLMDMQPPRSAPQAEQEKWQADLVRLKATQKSGTGIINRSM